jgi:hypothetical protein
MTAVPDPELRARFIAELPQVPLGYFEEAAPVVEDWPPPRCAYVQLSPAYEGEVQEAQQRGWPTMSEELGHLGMLTEPRTASACILSALSAS